MKNFFTLIELIVVIAVLGILAAIIIPNISSFQEEANETAIVSNVRSLQTGVDMYSFENYGSVPTKGGQPTEVEPKPIDFNTMIPDYTRDLPETDGVKYWVDGWGKVWASTIDAPQGVELNTTTLKWNTVPEADMYKVYKVLKVQNTSSVLNANKKLVFYKEASKDEYSSFPVDDENAQYAVSAVDNNKFESAPAGSDYQGHDNYVVSNSVLEVNKGKTCESILNENPSAVSGFYEINPTGVIGEEFDAYCEMSVSGGGWTLVWSNLSNLSSSPSGNLGWTDAISTKPKFAGDTLSEDPSKFEVYTGLDRWNDIMENKSGEIMYLTSTSDLNSIQHGFKATLQPFNPSENYKIVMTNYNALYGSSHEAGLYRYHNNRAFSTIDDDNDVYGSNCSSIYGSHPWWYGACWSGNINGYNNSAYWYDSSSASGHGWIFVR